MSNEQLKESQDSEESMGGFGVFLWLLAGVGAAYCYYRFGLTHLSVALAGASLAVLVITLIAPHRLLSLHTAWMIFGRVLGGVVNPIVLGFIFFLLVTPYALIGRASGRDVLGLRSTIRKTYWVARAQIGRMDEFFRQPF